MYHQMVKRLIRKNYGDISRADFEPVLKQFAPDIRFTFAGQHALAADFHSREYVRQWFQRLHRLFPGLRIEPQHIVVTGFPWDMSAIVQFTIQATLPGGAPYHNQGVQIIRIVRGQVVEDYLLEDTQLLAETLRSLAEQGVHEANAAPLHEEAASALHASRVV